VARQSYTPEQKRHALELVAAHGLAEAHRRSGIPKQTLSRWSSEEGVDVGTYRAQTLAASEARRLSWEERRTTITLDMGDAAADALRLVKRGLKDGISAAEASMSTADLKNYATIAAIMVDKAQLLTGGATTRAEHSLDPRDKVAKVRDELAARRRGAA
jgi:hypothetical protein